MSQASIALTEPLARGVQAALGHLGNGFLRHPHNIALTDAFRSGALSSREYYRQLLRLAYRLIFLFAAEDRDALLPTLPDDAPPAAHAAQGRYRRTHATTHLRALAMHHRGGPDGDRWQALRRVLTRLYHGCPELGLPALGSFLWSPEATPQLDRCELRDADLLAALRALCTQGDGRPVPWRSIGADELGSVHEALLELHPVVDCDARVFALEIAPGHERKTSGSYYTPSDLVECLLDTALDPVLDDAERAADPVAALLDLKICDPACGSGHLLLAAGRRLARRIARVRAGGEFSPSAYQRALHEVVARCLYGVDVDDMAVELCKVSLWIEALEPGRPLEFLDHHIQRGNALLGTTPELLARGLPDAAFTAMTGDDPEVARRLKKRNRDERRGPGPAIDNAIDPLHTDLSSTAANAPSHRAFVASPAYRDARFLADAWCAAFVWPRTAATEAIAPTSALLQRLHEDPSNALPALRTRVAELAETYHFFHWHLAFPHVFAGGRRGFDVVLGNPPWERIKLLEREFFAARGPELAALERAADRKRAITALRRSSPELWNNWQAALRIAEGEAQFLRASGRYPLCARGDINTYAIFAELMRSLMGANGAVGCIVPSGIATDATTRFFFRDIVRSRQLRSLYDFQSTPGLFGEIGHARFKFCILTLATARQDRPAEFAFFLRSVAQLSDPARRFALSQDELALLNPNTSTCPIFRTRRDADITTRIYRHVPILVRDEPPAADPWSLRFGRMLDMTNDSGLFHREDDLAPGDRERLAPLYEAKMMHQFTHRFGDYADKKPGSGSTTLPAIPAARLDDATYSLKPRYWLKPRDFEPRIPKQWRQGWLLAWRDICRSSDVRTVIAAIVPRTALGNTLPYLTTDLAEPASLGFLAANLSAFVLDYVARQKLGGTHLNLFVFKQLPLLAPEEYRRPCPWTSSITLADWLRPRILELIYTAWDLAAFARDHGWGGPPFRWHEERRFLLRAELDAAFFHLYAVTADDIAYILDTFHIVREQDEQQFGRYRTKDQILALHARMLAAMQGGPAYVTPLDPPPADPRLTHPPLRRSLTRPATPSPTS